MGHPLERYKKVEGDGSTAASRLGPDDWNGVLDVVGSALSELQKKGADFDAVATTAIAVLLDRINAVLGPAYDDVLARQAEIATKIAELNGAGVSASAVLETAARLFLTPDERTKIAANTSTLAAITGGADPLFDTFAEVAARLASDNSQLGAIITALANRLRVDAPQTFTAAQKAQAVANAGAVANGSGIGQSADKQVKIGADASNVLMAAIDALDLGKIWTDAAVITNLSSTPYVRFPNGLILQFAAVPMSGGGVWTFPTAFPNFGIAIPVANIASAGGSTRTYPVHISQSSNSSVGVILRYSDTNTGSGSYGATVFFLAIGY